MHELQFKDPILHSIIKDLYEAANYKLSSKEIISKYSLTREEFEKHLLLLEYHFICCLSYQYVDEHWQEVITPFAEWLEYLQTEKNLKPLPIQQNEEVIPTCQNEFGFIEDLTTILTTLHKNKTPLENISNLNFNRPEHQDYLKKKLLQLEFVKQNKQNLVATNKGLLWSRKSLQERITCFAVDPNNYVHGFENSSLWNLRTIHAIEKSLRHFKLLDWVDLNDFLKSLLITIGNTQPITLQKKGTKWKYVLPEYSAQELDFVSRVIMERCLELGIVMTGTYKNKPCFHLTQFGKQFIY